MKTQWNRPRCTEIKMDAEIGSYHEDDDRGGAGGDRSIRTAAAPPHALSAGAPSGPGSFRGSS